MEERIVLAYDVGTQSSRALLINQFGKILAKSQVKHSVPYESPNPDWAEKDADFYYDNICRASRDLKEKYPELFARIEAASITTIRDTVVCVDREGRPLRPAILWLDKRKAEGKPNMSQLTRMLFKAVAWRRRPMCSTGSLIVTGSGRMSRIYGNGPTNTFCSAVI